MLRSIGLVLTILATFIGWFWVVGIILNASVPDYVKQACSLYIVGSSVVVYYLIEAFNNSQSENRIQSNYIKHLRERLGEIDPEDQ